MNQTLQRWVEQMLGIEEAVAGEGTQWKVVATYPWAPWAALVLFLVTLAFVIAIYRREGTASTFSKMSLAATRILLILVVAFGMIPGWRLSIERTGLPFVVVIVDDSASMSIVDRYDDESLKSVIAERITAVGLEKTTRLNQAKAILLGDNAKLLKTVAGDFRLKVYYLSGAARAQTADVADLVTELKTLEPTGESSRLGDGLRSVLNDLRGTPPTAIILLSDGITTEGESLSDAAAYAHRKNVPILAVGLGSAQPIRDLELHDLLVDEVVFVDDIVYFTASITGTGYEGKTVELRLREKEKPEVLARLPVTIGPDGEAQQVRLPYRPRQVGEFDYVVELAEQEKEVNADNNRQQRHVSVREERIRVLLVQSYPSFEFRYLKTMLERDRTIRFKTVLQEADTDYPQFDSSALSVVPVSREELFEYDVILFGDVDPTFLSATVVDNLVEFVTKKGGGIIFFSGPRFTPKAYVGSQLADLFPINADTAKVPAPGQPLTEAIHPVVTELGRASPHMQLGDDAASTRQIWSNLPGIYWLLEINEIKPGARVLLEHPTKTNSNGQKLPVALMQPVGAGTVLFHATDDTWRWRYQVGDVYFARYWVQAIRFLSRSKLIGKDKKAELTSDRREYRRGQPVRLRVRFIDQRAAPEDDDGVSLMVERNTSKTRLALKRTPSNRVEFEGTLTEIVEGSYHVWLASPTLTGAAPTVDFTVVAPPGEFERVRMDATELKRTSEDTRGKFFTFANSDQLLAAIPEGRRVPVESLPPYPIWNKWPLLALCLGLVLVEWIMRKRKGML